MNHQRTKYNNPVHLPLNLPWRLPCITRSIVASVLAIFLPSRKVKPRRPKLEKRAAILWGCGFSAVTTGAQAVIWRYASGTMRPKSGTLSPGTVNKRDKSGT